ncbi:hypothetical protein P22_1350 [Propionispora sp. 2/2-37]|uniref:Fur family transcriptional regulator n=1 Tax=Propionispora sp. 2/2-37 TaxID=1677858 RepID=UPI0006BB7123|nr:Fur family transcriptional regulator [Propionispora sp. 2/2-37]CUH95280.1 hypothetical protein P22_1350 [Propionispora sp. 2/2-37]
MNISVLKQRLNGKYKLTQQRQMIFQILNSDENHHFSAEDIYEIIRRENPQIGLATIYRTLELLNTLDIVQQLDFGDGRHRYEINGLHSFHYHVICESCGKVAEIKKDLFDKLAIPIDGMPGFSIHEYRLYVYGCCEECQPQSGHPAC